MNMDKIGNRFIKQYFHLKAELNIYWVVKRENDFESETI